MIILGLGSNVGDRLGHLRDAVRRLSGVLRDIECSRILESHAILPPDAPPDWDLPYLNMAIKGHSHLTPQALLARVKAIESDSGRIDRGYWGPREIDIDILAMDGLVLDIPELSIPHRELLNRDFALLPLAELAGQWRYPVAGDYNEWQAVDIASAKGFTLNGHLRDSGASIHDA